MKGGVLAIDLGEKRSGFAAADPLRVAVRALEGFEAPRDSAELLAHVARLLSERDVSVLLVGLPRNLDGSEGPRAAVSRAFAARLRERFPGVEVVLHDESLSTKAAEELLLQAGHRGRERRARRDSWSALVVLRDWIESGEPR